MKSVYDIGGMPVFNNLHMKIFVLGAEGFVGRNIVTGLEKTFDQVFALCRKQFELGNVKHYSKFAFSDSIIVDCISKIDGSPEDIYSNNYENFTTFIDYLVKHDTSFRYVYLSTLSTNDSELTSTNVYVKSKYLAEQYLINNVKDYQIIRLTFPFGEGESANRLLSRIISKIRSNEPLLISNVDLSLMPISYLQEDIIKILNSGFNILQYYNTHTIILEAVVKFIYQQLNIECNYVLQNNPKKIIQPSSAIPSITRSVDPLKEIRNLVQLSKGKKI